MKKMQLMLCALLCIFTISGFAQVTNVNGLVVVVRYNDYKIDATNAQIDAMLNQETGFNLWGNTTSVKQYWKVQSDNKFNLSSTVVNVDLPQNGSYYHAENLPYDGGQRLVQDVVAAVNVKYPAGFTGLTLHPTENRLWHFSIISQSLEGAGVAYGVPETSVLNNGTPIPIKNVALISYKPAKAYEVSVICHEYGHAVMSWTDYYRTAFCNLGDLCVMASGGTPQAPQPLNPALRLQKNWITTTINVPGDVTATYTLTANSYNQIHKYTNPNNSKEYLLFHALQHGGYYQSPLGNKIPDQGLAIWYVDEDSKFDISGHEKDVFIRLVQADNLDEMHDESIVNRDDIRGDLNDLYDNISNTFPNGHPYRWKDGGEFGISISNISAPGATMSFTVNGRPNTVIASSDLNGTISPKGTLSTNGSSKSFTFTPNTGYEIDAIKVNGATVATANPYVLANSSGNQTIQVTFKKKATIDPLPNPWSKMDIGTEHAANAFDVQASGKFYIESASSKIESKNDNVNYIFQTLNGDGSIVVRLASSNMPTYEGKFGIMVRETLQGNSAMSLIASVPHTGIAVQYRASDGAALIDDPNKTKDLHRFSLYKWLKITRAGNLITNACSKDAVNWVPISYQTVSWGQGLYFGMFVTGGLGTYPAKALFDNISITTSNVSPTVSITSPVTNTIISNPSAITINATAADNGSITKVDFYQGKTFIGTDNTAPYSFIWTNVGGGKYYLTARAYDNQGAYTNSVPVNISVPCNFTDPKLAGTVIGTEGSWAGQGSTREKAFDGDINTFFDAPESIAWAGLSLTQAKRVTAINFYPRQGFAGRMIGGKFQGSNTADFSSGVVDLATITTAPAYEWTCITITNTTTFLYLRYICDVDGVGNVAEVEFYGVSSGGNTSPVVNITNPLTNASFAAPASIVIDANASDADGTISKVEFFNGSTLIGNGVLAAGKYSFTWSNVAAGTYALTAKATDNQNAVTTSAIISVTVTSGGGECASLSTYATYPTVYNTGNKVKYNNVIYEAQVNGLYNVTPGTAEQWWKTIGPCGAGNVKPVASITAPANNAGYTAPASISITANASDADGSITKVDFYNGTTLIGTDNTSPYSFMWNVSVTGTYTITVKATDNLALAGDASAPIVVTVTNQGPAVNLTAPTILTYTAPAAISIAATATDPNGVSKVDFYNGTTLLFSDATSPYSYSWTGVAAGSYPIKAIAFDNLNASTTSSVVTVTVNAGSNTLPTVSLTAPTVLTYAAPATISIAATAADADGTIAKVDFYNGATLLFSDATSPYSYSWSGVAAGSYTITAKAFDNLNGSTTSASKIVTVTGGSTCTAQVWNPAPASYSTGAIVQYGGIKYVANWWTSGDRPDLNNGPTGTGKPWTSQGTCNSRMTGEEATVSAAIYPNPNTGTFTIETDTETTAQITNALGKEVTTLVLTEGKNNISLQLSAGVYFVSINHTVQKLIVE